MEYISWEIMVKIGGVHSSLQFSPFHDKIRWDYGFDHMGKENTEDDHYSD